MSIKPIPNTAVATAVKTAFNDALDAKLGEVKVTVTGTGAVRSAVIRAGDDSFTGNLDVDANNVVSAVVNGAKISLNEWARLAKKATAAAEKAHAKVIRDWTDARKKADKKSAEKARKAQKDAAKKLADKAKKSKTGKKSIKASPASTNALSGYKS